MENAERARLYWQCRRGMLELDLLLQAFLDGQFDTLNAPEQQAFSDLLGYPDTVLLEYMLGRMIPTDKAIADVVAKIRRPVTS